MTSPPRPLMSTDRPSARKLVLCSPELRYQRCHPPLGVRICIGVRPNRSIMAFASSSKPSTSTTVTLDSPVSTPTFASGQRVIIVSSHPGRGLLRHWP